MQPMKKALLGFVVDVAKAFFSAGAAQAGINIAYRFVPLAPDQEPEPPPEPEKKPARKPRKK